MVVIEITGNGTKPLETIAIEVFSNKLNFIARRSKRRKAMQILVRVEVVDIMFISLY